MLVRHLPGLDLEISISQGSLITTHIDKVVVELIHYQEEKARLLYQIEAKGVTEFFSKNIVHLLLLAQVL